MNKMMKYFGVAVEMSEIDLLVEADENLLVVDATKKMARADRRRATVSAKKQMKNLATYSVAEIRNTGKVKNYGEKHYFKGAKAWSRKVRHEIFSVPMPEEPVVGEVTVDEDNDFVWQSTFIGEPIAEKVQDAWYLYNYDITMDAWLELVNIKKSIGKIREYNKILRSDKLADIADKLADSWSSKF